MYLCAQEIMREETTSQTSLRFHLQLNHPVHNRRRKILSALSVHIPDFFGGRRFDGGFPVSTSTA